MAKRKYTKKSDYWNKFNNDPTSTPNSPQISEFEPATAGEAYHVSSASYERSGFVSNQPEKNTSSRINRSELFRNSLRRAIFFCCPNERFAIFISRDLSKSNSDKYF